MAKNPGEGHFRQIDRDKRAQPPATKSNIMKHKTFATTFSSIADFSAEWDRLETTEPLAEPGKTETPEAREETRASALAQTGGAESF
jgi:hypothetical protein